MDDRRPTTYTFKTSGQGPPPQVGDVIQIAIAGIDPITVKVEAVSDDGMVMGYIADEEEATRDE